ncbi:MAG TPA: putative metal-binding motif-containing protein [Myxococcota bacterium]|nr:putative metal-binding motif-containing protein [Myxococcota bacterium]
MRWTFALLVTLGACVDPDPKDTVVDDTDNTPVDADADGVYAGADCNDNDDRIFPGAPEACDGFDNDCDGRIDDNDDNVDQATATAWYDDNDDDGWGRELKGYYCEPPRRGTTQVGDCDDTDRANSPGGVEICDGQDNDCDNLIDDSDENLDLSTATTWYTDADNDGHGDPNIQQRRCTQPGATSRLSDDCDDADPAAWATKPEVCNDIDDDCDGMLDESDPSIDPALLTVWYADVDSDGFGDRLTAAATCDPVPGYVLDDTDCLDTNAQVNPGGTERCNTLDDDCDFLVDDDDPTLERASAPVWFRDDDRDGRGDPGATRAACARPSRYTDNDDDCNDADPLAWTGNPEVCDGVDNDCQNGVDEADPSLDTSLLARFYLDRDGDRHGDPATGLPACTQPPNRVRTNDDCDDGEALAWTNNPERCDDVDNDCDDLIDEDPVNGRTVWADADRDGHGDPSRSMQACGLRAGIVLTDDDCNDADPLAWTGNPEVCDGSDNDCVNGADDADPNVDITTRRPWYVDADRDGHGAGAAVQACSQPAGRVRTNDDCNDAQPLAWTGATEVCDNVDNDCANGADDLDPNLDRSTADVWYRDADRDGHGDPNTRFVRCVQPPQTVAAADDCDDTRAAAWTGATEVCDGVDNDCANGTDDADPNLDLSTGRAVWLDEDRDGHGDPLSPGFACALRPGLADIGDDCHDGDATVYTGAPEICDLQDNDCDPLVDAADPDIDYQGVRWYTDADGDDYGVGPGRTTCTPTPAETSAAGDCNDGQSAIHPDALERCNTIDDDCDGAVDSDAWWNTAWPYRVFVQVAAPAANSPASPPIAVDVDFASLLGSVGDVSGLSPGSVRVVRQDCGLGLPEQPAEYMERVSGVFDKVDIVDPAGDGYGSVAFLADADGDYTTPDPLTRGSTVTYAIYFGSSATTGAVSPPAWPSSLHAESNGATSTLGNDLTDGVYTRAFGGLAEQLGPTGGDLRVASQTATNLGNGVLFNQAGSASPGQWVSARSDTSARLTVVHDGPVFGAVKTEGSAVGTWGGFDYAYTYMMFEGRPEVYVKVDFVVNRPSNVGPASPSWGSAVRLFLVDNFAIVGASATEDGTRDSSTASWVRGGYFNGTAQALGVALGYRVSPSQRAGTVTQNDGRWVGLVGQDLQASPTGTELAATAGAHLVDHTIIAVYPHDGAFASVSDDFYGVLVGATSTLGTFEAL